MRLPPATCMFSFLRNGLNRECAQSFTSPSMELAMQPPCGRNASPSTLRTLALSEASQTPCVFYNKDHNIRTLVHGDDYASVGSFHGLNWMRIELESKFDMKTTMVGHSKAPGVSKEGKILNRIIRATDKGWEYECDQRHVELLIEQLDLSATKTLSIPGVEDTVVRTANPLFPKYPSPRNYNVYPSPNYKVSNFVFFLISIVFP